MDRQRGQRRFPPQALLIMLLCGMLLGLVAAVRYDWMPSLQAEAAQRQANHLQEAFIEIAEHVGPAVVSISTEHIQRVPNIPQGFLHSPFQRDPYFHEFMRQFFGDTELHRNGLGSGVLIDQRGYVLTNEHVVSGADQIAVTLPDGREMAGVVMGSDPRADLAVIKIDGQDFPVATLGDSTELKPGQWVVALGNPFGYVLDDPTPSVTTGVVSALHRSLPGTSRNYTGLIQTDAAINPGNSGGPLVNLEGHVIGINVAIFSPSGGSIGLGFAIPVNRAKTIVETLIKGERVKYGWLGVEIQDLTPEVAAFYRLEHVAGVMVYNVVGGSPAAMAGMKDGDIIQSYAGRRVKNTRELMNIVGETSVGAKIKMSVVRGGAVRTIVVTIGERGGTAIAHTSDMHGAWRGLQVAEISAAVRQQYHVSDAVVGVVVVEVVPESPAARARMRVGDIINRVNERRIHDVETFVSAARGLRGNVLLRTVRGFVVIPPQ